MSLAAEGVGFRIGDATLLDGVDLDVPDGSIVGLLGPNGSGKSTLLRLLYRALTPQTGVAWIDTERLWDLPAREAARRVGAVPQEQPSEFELTVHDLVALGRLPHQGLLAGTSADDRREVEHALAAVGLDGLSHRRLDQLSGGERQRAVVARALAQRPSVLILDEPTNYLDVRHQHDLLRLLHSLGLTALVALHDLNLAAAYCDQAVVLQRGQVLAAGSVADVLVPETVVAAFGIGVAVIDHPTTGRRQLLFHPLPQTQETQ